MFGQRIDYWVLRAMAHDRNRRTESELDATGTSTLLGNQRETKFPGIVARFEGHLPIRPGLRYLDMGCGSGEMTLALARAGATDVTGVDYLPRFARQAERNVAASGLDDRVRIVCADLHRWRPPHRFDVLLSFDALEHIDDPRAFIARMADFLAPGGVAVMSFGPLFHSPFGDHMDGFFRFRFPWRGALFSEAAMMRVRREMYRPTDPSRRLTEVAGGLNLMRYSQFERYLRETGWKARFLQTNTFLPSPALRRFSSLLARVPGLRDAIAHNVYAVLERDGAARSQATPAPRSAPGADRMAA